jgi:hypothetical protein
MGGKHLPGYKKKYQQEHPQIYRDSNKRYLDRLRNAVFDLLGHSCAICGFNDKRALQIDHVEGGGSVELKGISRDKYLKMVIESAVNQEEKYQILCANCNWIKRDTNKELDKL